MQNRFGFVVVAEGDPLAWRCARLAGAEESRAERVVFSDQLSGLGGEKSSDSQSESDPGVRAC